jgi:hypothetical protein
MPALPQTAVAGMKISLLLKIKMLNNSFLFHSYVRFLQQLLFLLRRLLFDGSFVVVQANIAAAVVSAVDDAVVPLGIFLSQLPTVFSPVSHFLPANKKFRQRKHIYSTSAMRKLEE